jgi:hypothetical protein
MESEWKIVRMFLNCNLQESENITMESGGVSQCEESAKYTDY